MPRTNRRALAIAATAAAIVLVAGVAAAFALTAPTGPRQIAGVPSLATGLPLIAAEGAPEVVETPADVSPSTPAPTAVPRKPATPSRSGQTASPGGASGTSAGSASGGKTSASDSDSDSDDHDDSDDDRETVKPKVRDEHSDDHND